MWRARCGVARRRALVPRRRRPAAPRAARSWRLRRRPAASATRFRPWRSAARSRRVRCAPRRRRSTLRDRGARRARVRGYGIGLGRVGVARCALGGDARLLHVGGECPHVGGHLHRRQCGQRGVGAARSSSASVIAAAVSSSRGPAASISIRSASRRSRRCCASATCCGVAVPTRSRSRTSASRWPVARFARSRAAIPMRS